MTRRLIEEYEDAQRLSTFLKPSKTFLKRMKISGR